MKVNDLRKICQKSGISMNNFSFTEKEPILCEVTYCIRPQGNGFEAFVVERYEKVWSSGVHDEDTTCRILLKEIKEDFMEYNFS